MVGGRRSGRASQWPPWPAGHVTAFRGRAGRCRTMAAGNGERGRAGPGRRAGGAGSRPRSLGSVRGALLPSARGRGAGFRGGSAAASAPPCGCEVPQAVPGLLGGARAREVPGHRAGASAGSAEAAGGVGAGVPAAAGVCCRSRCPRSLLLLSSGVGAGAGSARAFRHRTAPFWLIKE